jgi:hypothetical protein
MNTITAPILPASPRPVDRCVNTGRVQIGIAHQRPPARIDGRDAITLQRALLDPRTAQPAGPLAQIIGRVWQWL